MSTVFLKILNLSINATWLILAVIVLRFLLKKAPRWITCILWALVAIRLVCPFSLESVFSLLPSGEVIPPDIAMERKPAIHTGISVINDTVNPVISETFAPAMEDSANPLQIILAAASFVWVIGMLLMLSYALLSFWLLKRKVRASIPVGERIMVCDEVKTPFILGMIRPVIYLPSSLGGQTYDMVKAHEAAHIKRLDHWWKPLGFVLLSVYWFNPACWVAYILLCRDIEAACDEKVIQDKGRAYAAAYSEALLALSMPRRVIAACPLAFGETDVKRRVKGVLHYKKPAFWVLLCALVGCVVVAVCFLTNPISDKEEGSRTEGSLSEDKNKDLKTWQAVAKTTEEQIENMPEVVTARITVTEDENSGMHVEAVIACAQTVQEIEDKKELQNSVETALAKIFPQGTEIKVETVSLKDIEDALSSSVFHGEFVEVPRPIVNLAATEGADNTQILYADKDIIIFSDYYGLFVYSKNDRAVITGLDLKSIGCNFTQGDNYCEKFVSEDSSTVYLHPLTSAGMYVYQYETDRLTAEDFRLDGLKLHILPEGNEDYHFGDYDEWTDNGKQMVTLLRHGGMIGELCYADFEKDQGTLARYYPLFAPEKVYYYICGHDGDRLLLDDVEWITDGSERAEELGLTEDDMPGGFYVYNKESRQVPAVLTDACIFTILDWEDGYSIQQAKEVDKDTFLRILDERLASYQEIEGGYSGPPYIIEMDADGISSIREQYVP
ncbi:MAG: hypothetical protein IJ716_04550 [Lachnospiraceae bacterium]|nr:hypothetical protein [Lachnospiraceae bacterium]